MLQDYFTPAGNQKKKAQVCMQLGPVVSASLFGHVADFRLDESA